MRDRPRRRQRGGSPSVTAPTRAVPLRRALVAVEIFHRRVGDGVGDRVLLRRIVEMKRASSAFVPNPISTSTAGMYAVTSTRNPACFTPRLGPGCIVPRRRWIDLRELARFAQVLVLRHVAENEAERVVLVARRLGLELHGLRFPSARRGARPRSSPRTRKYVSKPRAPPDPSSRIRRVHVNRDEQSPCASFAIRPRSSSAISVSRRARVDDVDAARSKRRAELLRHGERDVLLVDLRTAADRARHAVVDAAVPRVDDHDAPLRVRVRAGSRGTRRASPSHPTPDDASRRRWLARRRRVEVAKLRARRDCTRIPIGFGDSAEAPRTRAGAARTGARRRRAARRRAARTLVADAHERRRRSRARMSRARDLERDSADRRSRADVDRQQSARALGRDHRADRRARRAARRARLSPCASRRAPTARPPRAAARRASAPIIARAPRAPSRARRRASARSRACRAASFPCRVPAPPSPLRS